MVLLLPLLMLKLLETGIRIGYALFLKERFMKLLLMLKVKIILQQGTAHVAIDLVAVLTVLSIGKIISHMFVHLRAMLIYRGIVFVHAC